MVCVNWGLTILSVAIFVFTVWPTILGAVASTWVVAIAAILILILAWTAVVCKCTSKKKK
jgi:hypothetical protein